MICSRSLAVFVALGLAGVAQAQWNNGWNNATSGGYPAVGNAPAWQPNVAPTWTAPQAQYAPQYSGYAPPAPVTNWNNPAVGAYPPQVAAPQASYYAPTPSFGTPSASYPNYSPPTYAAPSSPGYAVLPQYVPNSANPANYYSQPNVTGYAPQAPAAGYYQQPAYQQPAYQQPTAVSPWFGSAAAMWRRKYLFP